ncbi:thioredoxin-disulfide reductase [Eggerthellaceae bacterium zg-997]|nr:thioredoxin-disulfide reductase [Eggerthellaceae bacterium zg-997]
MTTAPSATDVLDLAVIGGGPAGLTAGLYAARAGLSVTVFERISAGGQLAQTEVIENYPGFPEGTGGFDLAYAMQQQAVNFGAKMAMEDIVAVDLAASPKVLRTASGKEVLARRVVVASGARPRKLGVKREDELRGKGVGYCATCDGNFFRGKRAIIVGGGDTAAADAIYLSRICERVYLVHRRDQLRATQVYHQRLAELENVEFVWNATADEFVTDANGAVCGLKVRDRHTDEVRLIEASAVFVAVGTIPNTEFLEGALELDAAGYVVSDETGVTSVPGVWAAGDVRTKRLRQVSTAIADGAQAAENAAEFSEF